MKELLTDPKVQEAILTLAAEIIGTLVALASPLIVRWFRAHGVAISAAEAAQIETIARQGAAYAEEWARARAKGGLAPSGAEKLATAVDAARKLATGRLAKVAHEKLGVAVEAALPALRASMPPPAVTTTVAINRFGEVPLDLPEREP